MPIRQDKIMIDKKTDFWYTFDSIICGTVSNNSAFFSEMVDFLQSVANKSIGGMYP